MNRKYIIKAFVLCQVLLLAVSCSVKESRLGCPCILNMDYSKIRSDERRISAQNPDSLLVIVQGAYNSFIRMSEWPVYHTINVPRSRLHLACYLGMTEDRLENGRTRLMIPLGEDSDRLFSFHRILQLYEDSEEEYVTPTLSNEFTKVIISMDPESHNTASGKELLRVTGSTCGLDINTGYAIEGPFRYDMDVYDSHSYCFNMPRQKNRDIRIDAISALSGDALYGIDLAGELDRAGYDWNAESLPLLVVVEINAQNLPVGVRIIDWDEAIYFNYYL